MFQVTSPLHLVSPQQHFFSQNHRLGLANPGWRQCEVFLHNDSYINQNQNQDQTAVHPHLQNHNQTTVHPHLQNQNQTTVHQHLQKQTTAHPHLQNQNQTEFHPHIQNLSHTTIHQHLQNQTTFHPHTQNHNQTTIHQHVQNQTTDYPHLQNQFSPDVTQGASDELGQSHTSLFDSVGCGLGEILGPGLESWSHLAPPQTQCSPPGSIPRGLSLETWSSVDFIQGLQFIPDGYHDKNTFYSPTTPGPSPHYPQTPNISPGSPMLDSDQLFSQCDSYPMAFDPSLHHPHLHVNHPDLLHDWDQTILFSPSPQGGGAESVGSAALTLMPPAGHDQREEPEGRDTTPLWSWMKRPKPENSTKVSDDRLLCTVCKRVFRSLPALNGHMHSHSSFRSKTWFKKGDDSSSPVQTSVSVVMPVSVSRRQRCTDTTTATGGTVLYCSLMHLEEEKAGDVSRHHYTPPPMLHPLRAGPGLYCCLSTRRKCRAQTVHYELSKIGAMKTLTTGTSEPRINVGLSFQAEIPPLCNCKNATSDSHNALLLWTPLEELEESVNQHRVEALLLMAQSSVVPGGRASPEHALHILSESRGDFLKTVEKLLSRPKSNNKHTGSEVNSIP